MDLTPERVSVLRAVVDAGGTLAWEDWIQPGTDGAVQRLDPMHDCVDVGWLVTGAGRVMTLTIAGAVALARADGRSAIDRVHRSLLAQLMDVRYTLAHECGMPPAVVDHLTAPLRAALEAAEG